MIFLLLFFAYFLDLKFSCKQSLSLSLSELLSKSTKERLPFLLASLLVLSIYHFPVVFTVGCEIGIS